MSVLEGEIAETVADALLEAAIPLDLVLTRTTPGGGDPFDPDPPTSTDYACKGFLDSYSVLERAGSLIEAGDAKIVIVATTLSIEPAPGDSVTVRGKSYAIVNVSADPAVALYELQGRA
ncbi:MAG: hypothetical protein AB7K64_02010 [Variibacter sp.]